MTVAATTPTIPVPADVHRKGASSDTLGQDQMTDHESQPDPPPSDGPDDPTGSPSPSGVVLVVDDDPAIETLVSRVLQRRCVTTIGARSGDDALDLLRDRLDVGVVLLDLTMPGLSASETYRAIRALDHDPTVIIMSGWDDAARRLGPLDGEEPTVLRNP